MAISQLFIAKTILKKQSIDVELITFDKGLSNFIKMINITSSDKNDFDEYSINKYKSECNKELFPDIDNYSEFIDLVNAINEQSSVA